MNTVVFLLILVAGQGFVADKIYDSMDECMKDQQTMIQVGDVEDAKCVDIDELPADGPVESPIVPEVK
jgi:hypothetical protein